MLNKNYNPLCIGGFHKQLFNSESTLKQINTLISNHPLDIYSVTKDRQLIWEDIFDSDMRKNCIFNSILKDRELRIDQQRKLDYDPPFAIISFSRNNIVIRIEYYESETNLCADYQSIDILNDKLSPSIELSSYK